MNSGFGDNKYFIFCWSVCPLGQRVESYVRSKNCDLLHCPLVELSFGVGEWISRFGITNISISARLSVRWGRRVESYFRGNNCYLLQCPLADLSFGVGELIRRFEDYNIYFSARLSVRAGV